MNKKSSPAKFTPEVQLGLTVLSMLSSSRRGRSRQSSEQAKLEKAEDRFEQLLQQYEQKEFQPIDLDDFQQENILEDIEVDMDAFEAARDAFQQQQANILQSLRGVAGSSGAAGIATALSAQAQRQTRQMRLGIGEQLAQNRKLALQEQARLNDQMRAIQLANIEAERKFEEDRLATLLGVEGQRIAGIRGDIAQQRQARSRTSGAFIGALGNIASAYMGGVSPVSPSGMTLQKIPTIGPIPV